LIRSLVARGIIAVACMLTICPLSVLAFDDDDDDAKEGGEKNWSIIAGGAALYGPAYTGSRKNELEFFPLIIAEYEWKRLSLFIEGDELGMTWSVSENGFFSLSTGAWLGESRDESASKDLRGSGNFNNLYRLFGEVSYGPEWLNANLRQSWAPFESGGRSYNSALGNYYLGSQLMLIPFVIDLSCGMTTIDNAWAREYYGENGGIEKLYAESDILLFFSEFAGIYLNAGANLLLGGAAASPYSEKDFSAGCGAGAFIRL